MVWILTSMLLTLPALVTIAVNSTSRGHKTLRRRLDRHSFARGILVQCIIYLVPIQGIGHTVQDDHMDLPARVQVTADRQRM